MPITNAGNAMKGSGNAGPIIIIECPNILFPYARQVVASLTADGGFRPVLLNPVNFAAMYREQQHRQPADPA